jgi:hypothetical protein
MRRKGNCYDNAMMKSFWRTLKHELVYRRKFMTRNEATTAIFDYIEGFYITVPASTQPSASKVPPRLRIFPQLTHQPLSACPFYWGKPVSPARNLRAKTQA